MFKNMRAFSVKASYLNTLSIYTRISKIAAYVESLTTTGLICTKMGSPYFKLDNMGHWYRDRSDATLRRRDVKRLPRWSRLPHQVFKHRREVVIRGVELGNVQLVFNEKFRESGIKGIRLSSFNNNIACCICS